MNKFLKKCEPFIRLEYFFLFYSLVTILSYTSEKYIPIARDGLGILIIVWGAILFLYEWLYKYKGKDLKSSLWLLIFLVLYFVTTIVNRQYELVGNLKIVIYSGLQMLLVYPVLFQQSKQQNIEFFKRASLFSIFLITLLNIISIGGYLISFRGYSFAFHRLWGVYFDPNYGGLLAGMAIWFLYYFTKTTVRPLSRTITSILLGINLLYVILSQSRSAFVALLIGGLFILGLEMYRLVVLKVKLHQFSMILLLSMVGLLIVKTPIANTMQQFAVFVQYGPSADLEGIESDFDEEGFYDPFGERDDENKNESTRQRLDAWGTALKVFVEKPVLGTGYAGYIDAASDLVDTSSLGSKNKDMHNGYLVLLTSTGVLGFLTMGSFLGWIALRVFKKFNTLLKDEMFVSIVAILGCMAISIVFISDIFLINSIVSLWFFALLAIMNRMSED